MKILFANPAYRIDLGHGLEQYFFCVGSRCPWSLVKRQKDLPRYAMFPFFMGYAAALLEREGYEVEAIDAVPLNWSYDLFFKKSTTSNAAMIILEPATTSFRWMMQVAKELKESTQAIIVLTGSHISVFPEKTLNEYPYIDYILIGEYEFTLLDLVRAVNNKIALEDIDGIAYRSKSDIVVKEKRKYTDLDAFPFPARHLFPTREQSAMIYYHDGFCQNRPAVQMHASRGCPFACNFCLWTQTFYKPGLYRMASASRIVEEMIHVIQTFGAREIYFDDDTFTGNKNHVLQICKEIKDKKLNIPWSAMCDAMVTDKEMLLKMKDAGCIGVKFGLESAVPEILKKISKPLKLEKLVTLLSSCRKMHIKTHISVSFGHIGETEKTVKQTLNFASKLDSDSIQFSLATPYPGTEFYKEVIRGNFLNAAEWEEFDPTHNPVIKLPGLDAEKLREVESKAHAYWLRRKLFQPRWVISQLYFLFYITRRQGIYGLLTRLLRGFDILVHTEFK
jgi:anaerobic magnesium-protoporphyrin IX monomethyl ester cyclase